MSARIVLLLGNIVHQDTDAIVNAANSSLLGGGGVDGAIHDAAGPSLLAECRTLGGCPTGSARITGGHRLKARWIIHAVGPRYSGQPGDAEALASAYRTSIELAAAPERGIRSISFPSISTGIFRYPLEQAAPIALGAVREALAQAPQIEELRFVLWNEETMAAYQAALAHLEG